MKTDEQIELIGFHALCDVLLAPHAERNEVLQAYLAPLSTVDAFRLMTAVLSYVLAIIDGLTKDDPTLLRLELIFAKSGLPPIERN